MNNIGLGLLRKYENLFYSAGCAFYLTLQFCDCSRCFRFGNYFTVVKIKDSGTFLKIFSFCTDFTMYSIFLAFVL